jgi:hypothetical protein
MYMYICTFIYIYNIYIHVYVSIFIHKYIRQHESQMVKVTHMQEFVDKFRYNAKRASLVQSRIKAIEREVIYWHHIDKYVYKYLHL